MNTFLKIVGAALVGSIAVAGSVNAAPITTGPIACVGIGPAAGVNGNIQCDKWDSGTPMGGLLSMTLQITGSIVGTITLFTGADPATGVSGQTTNNFFAGALGGFSFGSPLLTVIGSTGAPINLAANTATVPAIPVSGNATTGVLSNNSVLAPYQANGGGSFLIPITVSSGVTIFGGGSTTGGSQNMTQAANAVVTYTYDDGSITTPEPASMALLGAGMLGLGFLRRRRG